jgi:P4 family phage/plasmid primase-like protien
MHARDAGWKRGINVAKPVDLGIDEVSTARPGAQPSDDDESATTGARPEPAPASKYSDIALSNQFAEQQGGDLLHAADGWRTFESDCGVWVNDVKLRVFTTAKRFLTEVSHQVYEEVLNATLALKKTPLEAQKAAKQAASAIASATKVAATVSLAQSHPAIAVIASQFDRDNWLLNTPAGVVNLRDGSIRPTRRNDYLTKCTAVAPREMETPVWDKFLHDIMGAQVPINACRAACCLKSAGFSEQERKVMHAGETARLAAYLTRLYGYCLTGDTSEHILVVQVGDGGNGKSLVNNVISIDTMGLAPDGYACAMPMEALLASKNERHPTELMNLFRTRLALARESDMGGRWNESRVKDLTGDDPITARLMRQDFVSFLPTHKLVTFTNVKPILRGSDQDSWKRRLHFVPFPQTYADVPDASKNVLQADKSLRDKLHQEAPGILHKLILGCLEYQNVGLQPPETIRNSSEAYLKEQNVIARWLEERCEVGIYGFETRAEVLWLDFVSWAEAGKEYVGHRKNFNERLERLGIRITRNEKARGVCEGVRFRPNESDAWAAAD